MPDVPDRHRSRIRHVGYALAFRAIPGPAALLRMPARLDHRAADMAREPGPLIDPHPDPRVESEVGAPLAAAAIEAYERAGLLDDLAHLHVIELAPPPPR